MDYARSRLLHIVGWYEAPARVGPTATPATTSRVGMSIAAKIRKIYTPILIAALVVSLRKSRVRGLPAD